MSAASGSASERPTEAKSFEEVDDKEDTAMEPGHDKEEEATPEEYRRKRKRMMLVVAYDGAKYHGSFSIPHSEVTTVDKRLWEALKRCDRLKLTDDLREYPSFPQKNTNISRCSRTDKGVHALRYMVSLDLAVEDSEISTSRQAHSIVEEINAELPEDIKVTSCVRVSNKFQAKKASSLKFYDYYLPIPILNPNLSERLQQLGRGEKWDQRLTSEEEQGLERLKKCVRKMVGIHSFHNFTKPKDRKAMMVYKGKSGNQSAGGSASNLTLFANEHDDFTPRADEDFSSAQLWRKTSQATRQIYTIDVSEPFDLSCDSNRVSEMRDRELYDTVYSSASPKPGTFHSLPMVKLTVVGSAFIFNQIRIMVGLAVAVGRGIVPEEYVDWVLTLPRAPMLPLAPPGNLVLRDVDFDAKYFICSELPENQSETAIPLIAQELRDYLLEEGDDFSNAPLLAIMHPPGLERENTFFKERLQPRLVVNTDALFEYPDYAEHARERFEFVQKVRAIRDGEAKGQEGQSDHEKVVEKSSTDNAILELKEEYSHVVKHPFYTKWQSSFGGWIALNEQTLNCDAGRLETGLLQRRYQLWREATTDYVERSKTMDFEKRLNKARNMFGDAAVWPEVKYRSVESFWKGSPPSKPEELKIDPHPDLGQWRKPNEKVNMIDTFGILPQGFHTSLMIEFRIFSSRNIHALMQAVALRIVDGSWPLLGTTEEYINYIKETGLDNLYKEGRNAAYLQRAQEIAGAFEKGGGKYLSSSNKRKRVMTNENDAESKEG